MSITKIKTPELLDFPKDSTSSVNTSGTVIPTGYTALCTFPGSNANVALYTMDGNADDSCGSLDLTNTNSVPFVTSSPWGGSYQSADFDPSASPDEYLTIASGLGSVADRTRSLWIYLDAIPSVFATVLYIGYAGTPNQNYEVLSVSSNLTGHVRLQSRYGTGTDADIESLSALSTSTWYHVAWVYQGTSIYLYVNGALQGSTTNTVTDTSSYPAFFGAWHSGSTEFDGKIAQARFYNTALNGDQIVDLYNENLTTYYRPTTSLNAGEFRYNEQLGYVEYYDGSNWNQIADEYITGQPTVCVCNYPTSAVALYEFQDNTNDTCGNYNGTPIATAPLLTYATGKYGKAAVFNKVSHTSGSYITVPGNLPFARDFSISIWFNPTSLDSGYDSGLLLMQRAYTSTIGGIGIGFYLYGTALRPWIAISGSAYQLFSAGTVAIDTWYHTVLTRTYNSHWELFLNGTSLGTYNSQGITADFSTDHTFYFGGNVVDNDYFFDGMLDQVRLFSSALNSSQVTELYNETPCN